MILRPKSDDSLMALVADVLTDARLEGDTRALLASFLIRRDLVNFPLVIDLGTAARMAIGPERARRMLNELRASGYLARAFWSVPFVGRAPAYSSICGAPDAIAAALAQFTVNMRPAKARAREIG